VKRLAKLALVVWVGRWLAQQAASRLGHRRGIKNP
jgi:hypothetical protein